MATEPNYYAVLGVSRDSEDIVIQAAYRALMRRYHPDKNPSKEAARKTIEINAAYAVLGDLAARAAYDDRRKESASQERSNSGGGANQPPPPPPPPKSSAPKPTPAPRLVGGRGGLIFASILTALIIGSVGLEASKSSDTANNTMNVDENLTTTDMAATTDISAVDMNAMNATDMNATDAANADEALNAAGTLGASQSPPDLSGQPTSAVDYSTIEDAARRVAKLIATKGMAGARAYSEDCHRAVEAAPSWTAADGCAAFDYAAAYIDSAVSTQAGWPKNGYFDFQSDNESDRYVEVGVPSYRTYDRLPKIRAAAQQAGLDAFRTEIARQDSLRRMRERQQAPVSAATPPGNSSD